MFTFTAHLREAQGKGSSRRLRKANGVPAIIYGKKRTPVSITIDHDLINQAQVNPSFYDTDITLVVDGVETQVRVKAMQRHPFKPKLLHLDFLRI